MRKRNTPHTLDSLFALTEQHGDCLVWQGCKRSSGYGVTVFKGKQTTTHRVAYELAIGLIPRGLEINHLCRNRACINPAHLVAMTHTENMEFDRKARTTCRAGHPWTEDNTYMGVVKRKQGGTRMQRYCRQCRAKHQADLRNRRKDFE